VSREEKSQKVYALLDKSGRLIAVEALRKDCIKLIKFPDEYVVRAQITWTALANYKRVREG
jgi:hypothetical protein